METLSLIPYTAECLEKSWVWLNDPEIRSMTMTPVFTREQQQAFFESLPQREDYHIWGVSLAGRGLVGAAGLKNHREAIAEYWGYLGERDCWGRGLGRQLIDLVEVEARMLGLITLELKVSAANTRAIALYERKGFEHDPSVSKGDVLRMVKSVA